MRAMWLSTAPLRVVALSVAILCFLPLWMQLPLDLPKSTAVHDAMDTAILNGALLVVLGAAASLLADDAFYFVDAVRTSRPYLWSRRMLILSIIVPNVLMYYASISINLPLFFCAYTSSAILQAYSLVDPLIEYEQIRWRRLVLVLHAYIQIFCMFGITYYYFYPIPDGLYLSITIVFMISVISLLFLALYYTVTECTKHEGNIAVSSFSFCVIMNILVKIIVPVSFGVQNLETYNANALFSFLIINMPILVIATVLPGRIARHEALIAHNAMEKQKLIVRFISHEVRTPLNTILLGIDELCASTHHDVLSDMKAASEVAVDTLNDLIAQHRGDCDADAMDMSEENAADVIQSNAKLGCFLVAVVNEDSIKEDLQYATLMLDKQKFSQALRSIIINSSRMTTIKGLVTLRCLVQVVPSLIGTLEPTCELLIEISNDGPGISREIRNKIFSSDQLTALDFGTGMGTALSLWTAKRIIERHGGHIEAKPNLPNDHGCVFFIRLPIEKMMDRSGSTHTASSHRAIMSSNHSKDNDDVRVVPKFNCLIVDDAPIVRKMIGRVVQDLFASIAYATNGEEATHLVYRSITSTDESAKFDIIFMDRCMPVKDGIEATRDIRNMGFQGVILGVTGDALAEDVDAFLQAGADKVVTKPIRADYFIDIIEDYRVGKRVAQARLKLFKNRRQVVSVISESV